MSVVIDKIFGFRSGVINELIDAVRSLRAVPGPGILVFETPAGTIFRLDPRRSGGQVSTINFKVILLGGNSAKVRQGHVFFHRWPVVAEGHRRRA
jgi:hypothetical protein